MEPKGKPNERKKPKTAKLPKDNFKDKKKEIKTRINALKKIIGQLNQENQAKDSKK